MFQSMEPIASNPEPVAEKPATDQPIGDIARDIGEGTPNCRRVLSDLIDMGREMAAILCHQIRSQTDDPEAAQATVSAFSTLARTIRRTVMLHEKLGEPKKPRRNSVAARKKIIRDVEDAIEHKAPPDEQEALHAELLERLDRPDLEEEIAERPIADIVTDITRDLGLAGLYDGHPWKRRIPHDIAILNARAEQLPGAAPSEKLLALLASAPPRPTTNPPDPDEDDTELDMKTLLQRMRRLRESNGG